MNLKIRKLIEDYIAKVFQISNYIARIANETLNPDNKADLKIVEPRARFSFEKNKIQLLFLIEASFEKEIEFIKLCGNIEKLIRELEHDYLANISCVNVSAPKEIDYSLIKSDYPFINYPLICLADKHILQAQSNINHLAEFFPEIDLMIG